MESVRVLREDLLERIKKNRQVHLDVVVEAQKKYREMVIEELDKMIADAKSGKRIRTMVHLVQPVNQTKEYDRAISMLEMSVEDEIEISQIDFQCYVLDDWGWKRQFITANSTYSSMLADEVSAEE